MADLTIVASTVVKGTGATTGTGIAGETITAGQPLYLKSSDLRYWLADANASSATAIVVGISLHASLAGQPIMFVTSGPVTIGATVAAGTPYFAAATPGGINAVPVSGWYVSLLGFATTAAVITVSINNSGVQVP